MRSPRRTVLLASIVLAGTLVLIITAGYLTSVRSAEESPLSNATVSFGAWMTAPPFDRFPNTSSPAANHHELIPRDGTQPGDINTALTIPRRGTPTGVPLINDPNLRIYRGPDPSLLPRDRVEVVHFANPGTYLVICGVRHISNRARSVS